MIIPFSGVFIYVTYLEVSLKLDLLLLSADILGLMLRHRLAPVGGAFFDGYHPGVRCSGSCDGTGSSSEQTRGPIAIYFPRWAKMLRT